VAVDGEDCALRVVPWLAARTAVLAIRPATYRLIIVSHESRMNDVEQPSPSEDVIVLSVNASDHHKNGKDDHCFCNVEP
jgi:hypothetical protein